MKKIILFICLLVVPINIFAISASSYVVMDQDTGNVLMESNKDRSSLIASITKIMTAIVVIENIDINTLVKVDESILKAYGSAIYIEVGEELTIKDLLYGLMLRSGNDAATMLAKEVSGSMEDFAELMNEYVIKLDLKNTNFVNSHGLEESDGANYSSAYDMALITKYAMENETFREISGTKEIKVTSSYKTYIWENKNRILHSYDYITGGKTGYTEKAKRTLVTTASKNDMNLIIVTLNDGNDFEDHITLYEEVFNNYSKEKILDKNITSLKEDNKNIYIKEDYSYLIKNNDTSNIEIEYNLYKEKVNNIVGKVVVYDSNNKIYETELYEEEIIKEESWWNKFWNWIKSW